MANGPDNQGGWQQAEPTEPPADLLRRALSHVEDLLGRLEYPTVKQGELEPLPDERPSAASISGEDGVATAVVGADPDVQHARSIARRIQDEARATADAILAQARRDAQLIRGQGRADAEQLAQEAELEAERTLAEAQALAEQRVAAARVDAERNGAASAVDGQDDTAVDAERARARELLESARDLLEETGTELRVLAETLSSSLSVVESSGRAIDALLASFSPGAGQRVRQVGSQEMSDEDEEWAAGPVERPARRRGRDGDEAGPSRATGGYNLDAAGPTGGPPTRADGAPSRSADGAPRARSPLGQLFGAGRR